MKPVDSLGELPRLRNASNPGLTSALQGLAARGPDASELASLASRLALQGVPMNAPAASGATTPGAGWKLALAGTATAVAVGAWLLWPTPTVERLPPAQPAATGFVVPLTSVQSALKSPRPNGVGRTAPSAAATPLASARPSDTPMPAPSLTTLPEPETREATPPAALAAPPQAAEQTVREPASTKRTPSASRGSDALATATPTAAADAPSELELLRGARLALKSSPAEALRLAEQHRSSYAAGKLSQERELIAISALVALGRRTAALARAASFERAFPTSPYRKQIGELLQ